MDSAEAGRTEKGAQCSASRGAMMHFGVPSEEDLDLQCREITTHSGPIVLAHLKKDTRCIARVNGTVYRPWGYKVVEQLDGALPEETYLQVRGYGVYCPKNRRDAASLADELMTRGHTVVSYPYRSQPQGKLPYAEFAIFSTFMLQQFVATVGWG